MRAYRDGCIYGCKSLFGVLIRVRKGVRKGES